jgi:hypothetical protein
MIYKLTYDVMLGSKTTQTILAENEIELACALLDMERDVGMFCVNVQIDKIARPENYQRRNGRGECLRNIQHYAKILEKAEK